MKKLLFISFFEPDNINPNVDVKQFVNSILKNKKLTIMEVIIEGYGDSVEKIEISENRANAVKTQFIELGIYPKFIVTRAFKKENSSDCDKTDRNCEKYYRKVEISVHTYQD